MPLKRGAKNIGKNIKEMVESGHSRKQAIAAALDKARESGANIPPPPPRKKKKKRKSDS